MSAIVFAFFLFGVFGGLLPSHWFGFVDFQTGRQVVQPESPFTPNLHIRSDWYKGDEAISGNLPGREHLEPRVFSTNSLGFRATPVMRAGEPYQVLVFRGFSFTWGATLSDEDTLAARLARKLGVNVFDGARFHEDEEAPRDYDRLIGKLGADPKVAVYVHLEPNAHTLQWYQDSPVDRLSKRVVGESLYHEISDEAHFVRKFASTWFHDSPMMVTTIRAKKALENDWFLPNRYRDEVRAFTIPTGEQLLVRTGDLERVQTDFGQATASERADFIAYWRDHLAKRGTRMVVLLVPEKMTVYGPALGVRLPQPALFDRMESELAKRGVTFVNGLPLLRRYMESDLANGRLAFRREDQHWSPLGVERLASATAELLKSQFE
jgi:hypothetical protein